MAEQGRAARDIIKAAQSTTKLAVQVRKATAEQAQGAARDHPGGRVDAARRRGDDAALARAGDRPPSRSRGAADGLAAHGRERRAAMAEQATAANEIARRGRHMRQQADQAAKALAEQTRAMKDMTVAAASTAKQIKRDHRREPRALGGGARRC